jgi:hypothetical protein
MGGQSSWICQEIQPVPVLVAAVPFYGQNADVLTTQYLRRAVQLERPEARPKERKNGGGSISRGKTETPLSK